MKTLATIIAFSIFTLSVTACSHNHTYSSGLFGGKTIKASKNYVTKNIKVDNFTGLNLAGSPDVTYTQRRKAHRSIYFRQYRRPSGH